jgi:AcrR family transcriptional regulator
MSGAKESAVDRRQRRRQDTIEEILAVAVEVMAEQGAGGLALGEIARRMGIRPPSLYVYFDSKNALYDAVFARGWNALLESMAALDQRLDHGLDEGAAPVTMRAAAEHFVRWAVEHPAYAQLMFWRPVPGFEPSDEAYAPAVEMLRRATQWFAELKRHGVLRRNIDLPEAVSTWMILISGVISQQLSNAPQESFDEGTYTRVLPALVSMFLAHYGPEGEGDDCANIARSRSKSLTDRPRPRGDRRDVTVRGDARAASRPR